jgi:hypothetical protein
MIAVEGMMMAWPKWSGCRNYVVPHPDWIPTGLDRKWLGTVHAQQCTEMAKTIYFQNRSWHGCEITYAGKVLEEPSYWTGAYGELRKELLAYLIDHFDEVCHGELRVSKLIRA